MTIPLMDPLPPQYYVRATSDRWLGSQSYLELSFRHLIRPESHPPHTGIVGIAHFMCFLEVLSVNQFWSLSCIITVP